MSSIKIVYSNTARRLTVNETTQWSEIAERLSSLFQLRPSTSIVLSYIDSDNDTITLNTTAELQEVIAQGVTKFNATIGGSDSTSDDWVVPGVETPRTIESAFESLHVDETPSQLYSKMTESTEEATLQANSYQTTIEDTEELPKYHEKDEKPKFDKGKQREETGESSRAGSMHTAEEEGGEKGDAFPFEKIQEQLQKLCEQFKDVIEQNPQLLETANALMEQLGQSIPVDIDIFASFLDGAHNDGDNDQRGPFDFAFRPGPPFSRGPFGRGPSCHGFRGPYNMGMTGVHPFFAGRPYGGRRGRCPARQREGECAAWKERHQRAAADAEQAVKAKIESLNAMGFHETFSDESFEELIGRYDGNIERVVDVLVQRQQNKERADDQKVYGYEF